MKKTHVTLVASLMLTITLFITSCSHGHHHPSATVTPTDSALKFVAEKPAKLGLPVQGVGIGMVSIKKDEDEADECSGKGNIRIQYTLSITTSQAPLEKPNVVEINQYDCGVNTAGKEAKKVYEQLLKCKATDLLAMYVLKDTSYALASIKIKQKLAPAKDGGLGTYDPEITIWEDDSIVVK